MENPCVYSMSRSRCFVCGKCLQRSPRRMHYFCWKSALRGMHCSFGANSGARYHLNVRRSAEIMHTDREAWLETTMPAMRYFVGATFPLVA